MKHRIAAGALVFFSLTGSMCGTAFPQSADENLSFKGDLRLRHETIDREDSAQRNRERIRARLNLSARLSESMRVTLGLASGSSDDPVSTNQTLTGGFSSKTLWLDLAYFDWTPYGGLHLTGGKIKNPFFRVGGSQLIWDSDLNPEGFSIQYDRTAGSVDLFAKGALLFVEERSSGDDSRMAGGQIGASAGIDVNLTFGASYLHFINAEGFPTFYDPQESFGNTVDAQGNYPFGFRELEFFGEIAFLDLPASPLLYADFVKNIAEDVDNGIGWVAGLTVGRLKAPGSWSVRYLYERLEANAVVGAFTGSDFIGGGTDGRGHVFGFDYQLAGQTAANLTYFLNEQGVENGQEYHRFQADLIFKF